MWYSRVAILLLGLLPSPDSGPSLAWDRLSVVPKRVAGRVLGSLVREGMTVEQVRRLLGDHEGLPTGGVVGGISFYTYRYPDLGLGVDFVSDGASPARVRAVRYDPLFGDR